MRMLAFASHRMTKSEQRYPAHKVEFLAMKWAVCTKFSDYLYGRPFLVYTDNNPLTYVLTTARLDATSQRWVADLAKYNFGIFYKAGTANADADGLSRRPPGEENTVDWPDVLGPTEYAKMQQSDDDEDTDPLDHAVAAEPWSTFTSWKERAEPPGSVAAAAEAEVEMASSGTDSSDEEAASTATEGSVVLSDDELSPLGAEEGPPREVEPEDDWESDEDGVWDVATGSSKAADGWYRADGDVVAACLEAVLFLQTGGLPLMETVTCGEAAYEVDAAETAAAECTTLQWVEFQARDPALARVMQLALDEKLGTTPRYKPADTDPSGLKLYLRHARDLRIRDGVLFRKTRILDRVVWQLVVPALQRPVALRGCHDEVGHLGRDRTLALLRDRFYWPGMEQDAVSHLRQCRWCCLFKALPDQAPLQPIQASTPLELVHLDFLKLDQCKGRFQDVLIVTDHFSRFAQALPCRSQTAQETAKAFLHGFVYRYGFPTSIITDQGANFEGHFFRQLCAQMGIRKQRTTPYHPQGNGQCERFNRTLISMLGTLPEKEKANWKDHLQAMTLAYNATRNASTGYSPYFLMFGREPRLAIDATFGLQRGADPDTPTLTVADRPYQPHSTYAERLRWRLCWARERVREATDRVAERMKRQYDRHVRGQRLARGDEVLVRVVRFDGRHKLAVKWEEPVYVVTEALAGMPVYRVRRRDDPRAATRTLHRNLLLPLPYQWDRPTGIAEGDRTKSEWEQRDLRPLSDRRLNFQKGTEKSQIGPGRQGATAVSGQNGSVQSGLGREGATAVSGDKDSGQNGLGRLGATAVSGQKEAADAGKATTDAVKTSRVLTEEPEDVATRPSTQPACNSPPKEQREQRDGLARTRRRRNVRQRASQREQDRLQERNGNSEETRVKRLSTGSQESSSGSSGSGPVSAPWARRLRPRRR